MNPYFGVLLALHLAAALVAYGSLLLPAAGVRAGWAALLAERVAVPALATMPFTGAGLLLVTGLNPAGRFWLWFSLVLYAATIVYLLARQRPRVTRLLRGERSPELSSEIRRGAVGIAVTILAIGALMMTKPG